MTFTVNRNLTEGDYRLRHIFSGLDNVQPLIKRMGSAQILKQILDKTRVTLKDEDGYMYVNDADGSLVVGLEYLRTGQPTYLYLDVIHELVHIKQFLQGRELFDRRFTYVERPTEIEAYQCCVEEARRIGLSEEAIAEYLYVEWISKWDHAKLLQTLGVKASLS
jgi:hypothetical protein